MHALEKLLIELNTRNLWEKKIELSRNDFLNKQGRIDTNLYFVESGSLRIYLLDNGEEQCIRFGYKGSILAVLDSFFKEKESGLYIQAIKKSGLKSISKKRLMDFVESSAEMMSVWKDILEELVFQQMEREQDLLTFSPLERYRRVLARSPQLFQEIPNRYIASYLRMTPETLSRIKKS